MGARGSSVASCVVSPEDGMSQWSAQRPWRARTAPTTVTLRAGAAAPYASALPLGREPGVRSSMRQRGGSGHTAPAHAWSAVNELAMSTIVVPPRIGPAGGLTVDSRMLPKSTK